MWRGQVLRPRHLHLHPGLGRAQVRGEGGVSPRQVGRLLRPALLLRQRLELQMNLREVCSCITTEKARTGAFALLKVATTAFTS